MSKFNIEQLLWSIFIRFSYILFIILFCFGLSIYYVLKHSRFSEGSNKERFEAIIICTLIFTICSSLMLYFIKYSLLQSVLLTSISIPFNTNNFLISDSFLFVFASLILSSIFVAYIFSEFEFHSMGSDYIVFHRRVPLPDFLHKVEHFFSFVPFFLFGDRYLVIKALEITHIPREIIRREQRPIILQENFQSTGIRKYEYEDIAAYLRKCHQGAQEIFIDENGTVKVRRYVFGTHRRLNKAIEDAQTALFRMKGGLESLSFEIDDDTISEEELRKITLLPKIEGYGSEKSLLKVKRNFLEGFSYSQRYASIIHIEGLPEHKAYGEFTQHDRFIRYCLSLQIEVTFVMNFKDAKIRKGKLEEIAKEDENGTLSNNIVRHVLLEDQKRQEASDYAAGLRSGLTSLQDKLVGISKLPEKDFITRQGKIITIQDANGAESKYDLNRAEDVARLAETLEINRFGADSNTDLVFEQIPYVIDAIRKKRGKKPALTKDAQYYINKYSNSN